MPVTVRMIHHNNGDGKGYRLQPVIESLEMSEVDLQVPIQESSTESMDAFYRMLPLFGDSVVELLNAYLEENPLVYARDTDAIVPELYVPYWANPQGDRNGFLEVNFFAHFNKPNVSYFHETPDWQTYNYEESLNEAGFFYG